MKLTSWQDLRAQKFTPAELREIDAEVDQELREMDLRALRETAGLPQEEPADPPTNPC